MAEWWRRQLGWIAGLIALIAWFAMLYYMFWDVL